MGNWLFISFQIAMVLITLAAIWRKQWISLVLFLIGDALFLYEALRAHDGWTELALFVTFLLFVVPLYVIGGGIWLIRYYRAKKR